MSEQDLGYDAFISYSRQDKVFAALLEKALEAYKPPKDLGVPQRYLRIFRDEQDFTGSDYHSSLRRHLQDSAKLIVVCSPAACQSKYVDDEIRQFVKAKGKDHLVPVLISGIPNNEARPAQEAERAFPKALCEELGMPIAADYRGFNFRKDKVNKGRFEDPWFKTLADLYGKPRDQIEQREKRRQIHRRNLTLALGGFVIFLILWLAWLWQNEYTIDLAWLKIRSLFASIQKEPEMVTVQGGTFRRFLSDPVTIKTFKLGKYEVTFDEYDRFVIATGRRLLQDHGWGRGRRPVFDVSWQDANDYADWLSQGTGNGYRLPSLIEWQYAAKSGGRDEMWAGTSDEKQLDDYAVFNATRTEPVGGKRPNGLGLYDMSGNVWEWVQDCFSEEEWEGVGGRCKIQGGAWNDIPVYTDYEGMYHTGSRYNYYIGFRLAQDIEP